jgi:hypothetical protein
MPPAEIVQADGRSKIKTSFCATTAVSARPQMQAKLPAENVKKEPLALPPVIAHHASLADTATARVR